MEGRVSALGHQRTLCDARVMSALPLSLASTNLPRIKRIAQAIPHKIE